jgi:predicted AAA+ superfamily ATPase
VHFKLKLTKDSNEVYSKFKLEESKINKYYLQINRLDYEKYLYYGFLPFMIALVALDNESIVYNQIKRSLEKIINDDIKLLADFSTEILYKIPAISYAVADMDAFNFTTLSNKFQISRPKIGEIFYILEKTEILNRVYPLGSHLNQITKKPSKYLFSTPAFRAMYYKIIGNTMSAVSTRRKLLEDLIEMYLHRILNDKPDSHLVYDSAKGRTDFIVKIGNKNIVIEVEVNKDTYKQIVKTLNKLKSDYGMVITKKADELQLNNNENIIKIF